MSYLKVTITVRDAAPPRTLYRVLHDPELFAKGIIDKRHAGPEKYGWMWRNNGKLGVPEVFNTINSHRVPMSDDWQRLSFGMNIEHWPYMSPGNDGWRQLYDDHRAFSNNTGFNSDGMDQYRDVINGYNLGAAAEIPALDGVRLCGGAVISGVEAFSKKAFDLQQNKPATIDPSKNNVLIVDTLKIDNLPTAEEVFKTPWLYFEATTLVKTATAENPNGSTYDNPKIGKFPQRHGESVYIPLVSVTPVMYPLHWLERVDTYTDPYTVYEF